MAATLARLAVKAWDDIRAPSGHLRFEHDHYTKMWALTNPTPPGEFILLDEAQDTNPVIEEVFLHRRRSGSAPATRHTRSTRGAQPGT